MWQLSIRPSNSNLASLSLKFDHGGLETNGRWESGDGYSFKKKPVMKFWRREDFGWSFEENASGTWVIFTCSISDFTCSRAGQFLANLDSACTYKAPSQAQPSLHSASRSLLTPWSLYPCTSIAQKYEGSPTRDYHSYEGRKLMYKPSNLLLFLFRMVIFSDLW